MSLCGKHFQARVGALINRQPQKQGPKALFGVIFGISSGKLSLFQLVDSWRNLQVNELKMGDILSEIDIGVSHFVEMLKCDLHNCHFV